MYLNIFSFKLYEPHVAVKSSWVGTANNHWGKELCEYRGIMILPLQTRYEVNSYLVGRPRWFECIHVCQCENYRQFVRDFWFVSAVWDRSEWMIQVTSTRFSSIKIDMRRRRFKWEKCIGMRRMECGMTTISRERYGRIEEYGMIDLKYLVCMNCRCILTRTTSRMLFHSTRNVTMMRMIRHHIEYMNIWRWEEGEGKGGIDVIGWMDYSRNSEWCDCDWWCVAKEWLPKWSLHCREKESSTSRRVFPLLSLWEVSNNGIKTMHGHPWYIWLVEGLFGATPSDFNFHHWITCRWSKVSVQRAIRS